MPKITIIGMGLIGTSLGLALKKCVPKGTEIVGTDIERGNSTIALRMSAVDRVSRNLRGAAEDAQVVFVATPVIAMKDVLQAISPSLMDGALVTDTGASKGMVMEWADEYLPRGVDFIGGHPIVRVQGSGPSAADGSLFQGQPYCILPGRRARKDSVNWLTNLLQEIGAKPYFIDVEEHDSFVAAANHLPLLLSVALVGCTSKSPSWSDISQVASGAYRDLSHPCAGDPANYSDLALYDKQNIVQWIDAFIRELYEIRTILSSEEDGRQEALDKVLTQAFEARNRWHVGLASTPQRVSDRAVELPTSKETMQQLFMGDSETRRRILGWGDKRGKGKAKK